MSQERPSSRATAAIVVRLTTRRHSTNRAHRAVVEAPARASREGVVDEDHPLTGRTKAAVGRDPDPQLQRMPGHGQVSEPTLHGIAVEPRRAAPGAAAWSGGAQLAPHHRLLPGHGGIGDRHPEFDGPDDRVGEDRGSRDRRLGHRAPRWR